MKAPIYLDHLATTPCDPRVVEALLPYLTDRFGNPGSRTHAYGWAAEEAVKLAREQVAAALDATPREIIFTSGATEASNLAIKGVAEARLARGRHVITQATEHHAVLAPFEALERHGFSVTRLPVDAVGRVDPGAVEAALRPDTVLVSLMLANNEIGTLQPVAEVAALCRARDVLVHTDAAQAVGKIPVDVRALGVDLLSLSGHKIYGPKGIGALYVRHGAPRVAIVPQTHGGNQERGLRAGTLPVHQIVGLGEAMRLAGDLLADEGPRIAALRDRLQAGIFAGLDGVTLNGPTEGRLPGALNLSFDGVDGQGLIAAVRDLALSSGSACMSDPPMPSHVLAALGRSGEAVHASLRFGLGRGTTEAEIDAAIDCVVAGVRGLRARRAGVHPRAESMR
ncbi:MAG: aminotransferase class V-fold PLP-dependent enzyme [bacterium]